MTPRRTRIRRPYLALLCAIGFTPCAGCDSKHPATSPVVGKVSWRGKPVENATVTFSRGSKDIAKGEVAIGTTDAEGNFSLMTHFAGQESANGAVPGDYEVTVSKQVPPPGVTAEQYRAMVEAANKIGESGAMVPAGKRPPLLVELFPAHYSAAGKSRLKAAVPSAGSPDANFALE